MRTLLTAERKGAAGGVRDDDGNRNKCSSLQHARPLRRQASGARPTSLINLTKCAAPCIAIASLFPPLHPNQLLAALRMDEPSARGAARMYRAP
ncbi:hypothetical protein E2C01_073488 [Portunus trituberculatus]|uniref:Uncharacterized protein n=1 Tax=Portunus trituberculatus TaxID=210409 RepID=A0A5B7IDN3_PORTR|nr:hypothetical protein [Portunus trituberculatus]